MTKWRDYRYADERYSEARNRLEALLTEQERLFERTQPGAVEYDAVKVETSGGESPFDAYLAEKERKQLDFKLSEARIILFDRERLRNTALTELRASQEIEDKVYCLKVLDCCRVSHIALEIGYSESQIYRILSKFA